MVIVRCQKIHIVFKLDPNLIINRKIGCNEMRAPTDVGHFRGRFIGEKHLFHSVTVNSLKALNFCLKIEGLPSGGVYHFCC